MGSAVVLHGLSSASFNGRKGVVVRCEAGAERVQVQMNDNKKVLAIKLSNLKLQ